MDAQSQLAGKMRLADIMAQSLEDAAVALDAADAALRGPHGLSLLIEDAELRDQLRRELRALEARIDNLENELDRGASSWSAAQLEAVNAGLVHLRDAAWATGRDRLNTAEAIADLCGTTVPSIRQVENFAAIQSALSALDRLEVRGRDSAGVQILVSNHGLDLHDEEFVRRSGDELYRNGAVRSAGDGKLVSFVYKRAAEIGELGDNVAALRDSMRSDRLLHQACASADAEVTVLGHTRWASVGIISEANAHPLDQVETDGVDRPFVAASLNGDVDNHQLLVSANGLEIAEGITTDAKVIPTLVSIPVSRYAQSSATTRPPRLT